MIRNYKCYTNCELCGELTCKVAWKQRRCKKCVPTKAAYRRACRYGISQPQFEALLESQKHQCALCKKQLIQGRTNGMHVDHDHHTGQIRGLLCGTCNVGIGFVERLLRDNKIDLILKYINKV